MLKDKTVVITGGSRGIGQAIAEAFARAGANLFLISRTAKELSDTKKELGKFPVQVETGVFDISQIADVRQARQAVVKKFDRVDVLVNAAGIYGPIGLLEEIEASDWLKTLAVNIFGTMLMCREFLPLLKQGGGGKIINFVGGGEGPFPRFTAYAASKGAVIRFTESLAEEVKENNIFVNAIAPGAVNTALLEEVLKAGPDKAGEAFYKKSVSQKQEGGVSPAKAAALALFLASSESDGLTGRVMSAVWDNWQEIPRHLTEIAQSDIYTYRRIKPKDRGYDW